MSLKLTITHWVSPDPNWITLALLYEKPGVGVAPIPLDAVIDIYDDDISLSFGPPDDSMATSEEVSLYWKAHRELFGTSKQMLQRWLETSARHEAWWPQA